MSYDEDEAYQQNPHYHESVDNDHRKGDSGRYDFVVPG